MKVTCKEKPKICHPISVTFPGNWKVHFYPPTTTDGIELYFTAPEGHVQTVKALWGDQWEVEE